MAERKIVKKRRLEENKAAKGVTKEQPRAPLERPRGVRLAMREQWPMGFPVDCPKRLLVAPGYPLGDLDEHIGHVDEVWNVSPGGAEDCRQRCWEVSSPEFGTANVCVFGRRQSCVHLHGYLTQ